MTKIHDSLQKLPRHGFLTVGGVMTYNACFIGLSFKCPNLMVAGLMNDSFMLIISCYFFMGFRYGTGYL